MSLSHPPGVPPHPLTPLSPHSTIWYELHAREWPFKTQPAEAIIWQVGRGMKPNLSQIGMGKEISVGLGAGAGATWASVCGEGECALGGRFSWKNAVLPMICPSVPSQCGSVLL